MKVGKLLRRLKQLEAILVSESGRRIVAEARVTVLTDDLKEVRRQLKKLQGVEE